MGFDPRRWDGRRGGAARVTGDAGARTWEPPPGQRHAGSRPRVRVTLGSAPGITPDQVRRWGEAMAGHPRWGDLRLEALGAVAEQARARGLDPALPLEEALEQRSPGLGRELRWALRGARSRGRLAVRAAFALHGLRAPDLLDRQPLRLVQDLLEACGAGAAAGRRETPVPDPQRQALKVLGLEPGASREAVRAAHRRLVKRHHPDVGGDAETFRMIDGAYRLLIA